MCSKVEESSRQADAISARVLDDKDKTRDMTDLKELYSLHTRARVFHEWVLSTPLRECNYGEVSYACLES